MSLSQWLRRVAARRVHRWRKLLVNLRSLWLRFDDEAQSCPACGSSDLTLLDVLRVRADMTGRKLVLLTGCEGCGLLFTNPSPDVQHAAGFYDEEGTWGAAHAERVSHIVATHEKRVASKRPMKASRQGKRNVLFEAMAPYVPVDAPPAGSRVIDFGCGEGKLLNSLQDAGWETYGIEPSTDVAFLRHRRLDRPPADGGFDLAILHHVLEHVPRPLDVLHALGASLREGGMLFVSVPRLDTVAEHGDFRYCINGRQHLVSFTESCLRNLLARAGFEITTLLMTPAIDGALTNGTPLRLRLLARKTSSQPPQPPAPLNAAKQALTAYARQHLPLRARAIAVLPPRLRAGWIQWQLAR